MSDILQAKYEACVEFIKEIAESNPRTNEGPVCSSQADQISSAQSFLANVLDVEFENNVTNAK
jgi:hypothetical protein